MNLPAEYAIKHFFPTSAFDLIYSEAVANSFDAGATEISIGIELSSYTQPKTLRLKIRDNGIGFTDENYNRFSNLMMTKDSQHKGLGRLVYLQYFTSVNISSVFGAGTKRTFLFNDSIQDHRVESISEENASTFSELCFNDFKGVQLKSYDNVTPCVIKRKLKDLFMPRLFSMKQQGIEFKVTISLKTEEENPEKQFVSGTEILGPADIADFDIFDFKSQMLDLIESDCKMLYKIQTNLPVSEHRLVTALCVDDRTFPIKIATEDQLPAGTSAVFLLQSAFLDSKTNESRQELSLKHDDLDRIAQVFMEKVAEKLNEAIPQLQERNKKIKESLSETYPHLAGYFNQNTIGIINRNRSIADAQTAFCKDEKDILEARELSDDQYLKSLEHASRVLTQYILYRSKIIRKMQMINANEKEAEIHNIIVPMKQTFGEGTLVHDLYNNNAWLLDDKYMTYQNVLSDKGMKELMERIMGDEEKSDVNLRPDIAFVFSGDIEQTDHKVDVVIVELKRKGLDHLGNHAIIEQIRQRARRLASVYPSKIQRMWFFGIIDFDDEMRIALKEEHWSPLYSKGESYYREISVLPVNSENKELPGGEVPVAVTLLSQDSLWKDALARNETFLSILKDSIKRHIQE